MNNVRRARRVAGAALVVALTSGCSQALSTVNNAACDDTLAATGEQFEAAMTSLVTVSGTLRASLAVACAGIASDLGMTPPAVGDGTMATDAQMQQACDMATTAIKAAWMSPPLIEGGQCTVDAMAQFNCESACDVSHMCTTPSLVARCKPADLSGMCSGECEAKATCEGSASVEANCQGTCAATCSGTCTGGACVGTCGGTAGNTGPCTGTCVGECSGTCTGTCNGDCTLDSTAMLNCGATATCKGGCMGTYTAPVCEGTLTPPSCTINTNCEAACEGQGSFRSTCTPPTVVVPGGSVALQATLKKNLPAIVAVDTQVALMGQAAANVSTAAQQVAMQISASAACVVVFGAEFATQVTATVAASTTISVSVTASATVSTAALSGQ
jgi:hypothetical protein